MISPYLYTICNLNALLQQLQTWLNAINYFLGSQIPRQRTCNINVCMYVFIYLC